MRDGLFLSLFFDRYIVELYGSGLFGLMKFRIVLFMDCCALIRCRMSSEYDKCIYFLLSSIYTNGPYCFLIKIFIDFSYLLIPSSFPFFKFLKPKENIKKQFGNSSFVLPKCREARVFEIEEEKWNFESIFKWKEVIVVF